MITDIPSLTGVRAIAAFMVYFHHFNIIVIGNDTYNIQSELYIGVTMFFVLSGFLLTIRYKNEFTSIQDVKVNAKIYFLKRIIRIYPIYFILILTTLLLEQNYNVKDWILNLTLLKSIFYNHKFSGISQSWSLTVEECFYFILPLLLLFRKKIIFPLLALSIIVVAISIVGDNKYFNFLSFYTFIGRSFEFIIGYLFGLMYLNKSNFIYTKWPNIKTYSGLLTITILLLISTYLGVFYEVIYSIKVPIGLIINNYVFPLFIGIFLLGISTEKTKISLFLSSNVMRKLGKSSYIFYLIHMGFIQTWLSDLGFNNFTNFFILIVISIILHATIEKPLNKLLTNFVFK